MSCNLAVWGGSKYHENAALDIVIQTRVVPALAKGDTGLAKTQSAQQLADKIGYTLLSRNVALHTPEEFGGIPYPDFNRGVTVMLPLEWTEAVTKPKMLVFFDEITTLGPELRPVIMKALSERELGTTKFAKDLIVFGACNPPEMSPNGTPLERPFNNRFYHHNWVTPVASWLKGMRNGGKFSSHAVPVVPDNWEVYCGKWCTLVAQFCESTNSYTSKYDQNDDTPSFASLRSWYHLALSMSAAESVDCEPEIYSQIGTGLVGQAMASEFFQFVALQELYSPLDVLDGTVAVDFSSRLDILHCLPAALVRTLANPENMTHDRYRRGAEFFAELAVHHADLVLAPIAAFTELQPEGYVHSQKFLARMGDLFALIN